MIGFHLQESPQNWPEAVAKLRPGTPVKFTDAWERCIEAKAVNPAIKTWVRHVEPQPHPYGDPDQLAREMFQRFVNPEAEFWQHVDYVQGWNEFYANSQDETERNLWVDFDVACARVWFNEYRLVYDGFDNIRYIMSEPGVGNDIPLRAAQGSVQYDALLGYHAYFLVNDGVIEPSDWQDLSGRFEAMDTAYKANGLSVDWIFGEAGAYRDAKSGWRHERVYGGDIVAYLAGLKYWLDNTVKTQAYRENRVFGSTLFTSGGGNEWKWFEIAQPHMNTIADFSRNYTYPGTGPIDPPPPPPPNDNLVKNWSFEDGWEELNDGNQRAYNWQIGYTPGVEIVHRECGVTLPGNECAGQPDALILDGKWVYKAFTTADNWHFTLYQVVKGKPNSAALLKFPVLCDFKDRPDNHKLDDTTIQWSVNDRVLHHVEMTKALHKKYIIPDLDIMFDEVGVATVQVQCQVTQKHPTGFFFDAVTAVAKTSTANPLDALWAASIERQAISLNPDAALQAAIFADNYVPVQSEFRAMIDNIPYAVQAAEHLETGDRLMYYAIVPKWNDVKKYQPTNGTQIEEPFGIDVSHHQGQVNWKTAVKQGVNFAFIRASQGTQTDSYFGRNWNEAKQLGILRGAYHFLRFDAGIEKQIDHFLSLVSYDFGELPLVLDVEYQPKDKAKTEQAVNYLRSKSARPIIIYTRAGYWNGLGDTPWITDSLLWIADIDGRNEPIIPDAWNDWKFWQYTWTANALVYGAESDDIDLNRFNGSWDDLLNLNG